jgi:hypothetical protein
MILSATGADAMLAGNFSTSLNNGYIRLYSGTAPTTTGAAAGTLLAGDGRFGATAFSAPSAGTNARQIVANTMTSDPAADAGGTPTHCRLFQSDGTTVIAQLSVTVSGGGGELQIDSVPIVQNAPINFTGLTISMSTL